MLESMNNDVLGELLRLSLLAFLTIVFWNFPGVKLEYPYLSEQLRKSCLAFTPSTDHERFLLAWALMMGSISVFDDDDQTWLPHRSYPLFRDSLGMIWSEVRDNLKQVIWIDSLHDSAGMKVFNRYLIGTTDVVVAT